MGEPLPETRRQTAIVTLIVAIALFMQNLDGTVLSTAIPTMARDFGINPVDLKLALTAYLLALAIFIPASGWIADRFGARTVFCTAMVVFVLGSIACALSKSLAAIVAARVLQGMGGAMMVPVGRLVMLRTVPRADLVGAMALLSMPALLGPILGPPLGGFITTFASWHWIFWINVPIAAAGVVFALLYIPETKSSGPPARFDFFGFALIGPGLSLLLTGASLLGIEGVAAGWVWGTIIVGIALIMIYVRYALSRGDALIDLNLLRIPTFGYAIAGGFLFRVGIGASPFLLPLLLQEGLAFSAFHSGLITFVTGIGSFAMKAIAPAILQSYGFRRVLLVNAVLASVTVSAPVLFIYGAPMMVLLALLFAGGFFRSLQFTSLSAVIYADIPDESLSRASTFAATLQELSGTVGIAIAALVLQLTQRASGGGPLAAQHFTVCFLVIGAIALSSLLVLRRMGDDAGGSLIGGRGRRKHV